jgi:hypothetical protein
MFPSTVLSGANTTLCFCPTFNVTGVAGPRKRPSFKLFGRTGTFYLVFLLDVVRILVRSVPSFGNIALLSFRGS